MKIRTKIQHYEEIKDLIYNEPNAFSNYKHHKEFTEEWILSEDIIHRLEFWKRAHSYHDINGCRICTILELLKHELSQSIPSSEVVNVVAQKVAQTTQEGKDTTQSNPVCENSRTEKGVSGQDKTCDDDLVTLNNHLSKSSQEFNNSQSSEDSYAMGELVVGHHSLQDKSCDEDPPKRMVTEHNEGHSPEVSANSSQEDFNNQYIEFRQGDIRHIRDAIITIISKAEHKLNKESIQGTPEFTRQLGIIAGLNVLAKELNIELQSSERLGIASQDKSCMENNSTRTKPPTENTSMQENNKRKPYTTDSFESIHQPQESIIEIPICSWCKEEMTLNQNLTTTKSGELIHTKCQEEFKAYYKRIC